MRSLFNVLKPINLLLVLVLNFFSTISFATVDSIGSFKFIYQSNIQEGGIEYDAFSDVNTYGENYLKSFCVASSPYFDGVSSSMYPSFYFMTQPYEAQTFGIDGTYDLPSVKTINLNVLSHANLRINFDFDSVSKFQEHPNGNFIFNPSFVIDLSQFPSSTKQERFEALVYAKLAILGIIANIESPYSIKEGYKAEIEVIGLPDQSDITSPRFTKVYSQTKYPYSVGSPVVANYKSELFSKYCSN